jgi:hydrogenase maturation protease
MTAARPTVRLLVCGAADRGDDGAALVAVATLLPILPPSLLGVLDVRRCGQLQVDDLVDVPHDMAAIVVDAAVGIAPGSVAVVPLDDLLGRRDGAAPHSSHALPVDQVIAIAAAIRGRLPAGSFVGIGGRRFSFGQVLSRPVRAGLPAFRTAIEQEITRLSEAAPSVEPAPPAVAPRLAPVPSGSCRTARHDGPGRPRPARVSGRTLGA